MSAVRARRQVRVSGTVQGVGFRPFVLRLAREEGLGGFVRNDERGVLLEVEGVDGALERFLARLRADAPPLAAIDELICAPVPPRGEEGFAIVASERTGVVDAPVTPDAATCPDCLAELLDPGNRRYRYPFVNCTNCGPRFTIVRGVPYDRPQTTMASFEMCPACRREYEDPLDRRFHAQPNACGQCGPRARLLSADRSPVRIPDSCDAVHAAALCLAGGAIAAVKGIGGYHLACDAADEHAVAALRARKHREDKPFALMLATAEAAERLVVLDAEERELLRSSARPIVLARRVPGAAVAAAVAPASAELGVMVPYTPLHHLLLRDFAAATGRDCAALVLTSGNVSDEPIAFSDEDALERLSVIADVFLVHDRPIATRTDDSVVRVVSLPKGRRGLALRRSRGYVPRHLPLPVGARTPLLACGAEQKSTFCVAKGSRAWVSHHIGDLEHAATVEAYERGIAHFEALFDVRAQLIAHDLHPGYLSTAYALRRSGEVELLAVQHHHAHLAACLAEHGVHERALGAIFDGTGLGSDGAVWGGELLAGDLCGFTRVGWVRPVPLPGGSAAIRQPWRMAWAWLAEAAGGRPGLPAALERRVDPGAWRAMAGVAATRELSPQTTSVGRLFDAVGALCGLRTHVTYEGQAAVELEAAATASREGARESRRYTIELTQGGATIELDPRPAIRAIAADVAAGSPVGAVAAGFHDALARATETALCSLAAAHGIGTVVLSGGVFQNRLLLEDLAGRLHRAGLRVLVPERLPPNDGGISYGQAVVAAAISARG